MAHLDLSPNEPSGPTLAEDSAAARTHCRWCSAPPAPGSKDCNDPFHQWLGKDWDAAKLLELGETADVGGCRGQ